VALALFECLRLSRAAACALRLRHGHFRSESHDADFAGLVRVILGASVFLYAAAWGFGCGNGPMGSTTPDGGRVDSGTDCPPGSFLLAPPRRLEETGEAFYRYAPNVFADGDAIRIWMCGNTEAGVVRDHILYSEMTLGGTPSPPTSVFENSASGWDSFHVCDPSIVEGDFALEGVHYRYAMFYSGGDLDAIDHVQLGVALSPDLMNGGTWTRIGTMPLIEHPADGTWGTGQPSAISIDGAGRVLVFYTRADPVPHVYTREVDLSDAAAPVLGTEQRVSEKGIVDRNGAPDVLTNVDVVWDEANDSYSLVTEQHPFPTDPPAGLVESLELLRMDGESLRAGSGTWSVLGLLDETTTGRTRNHNAGLVRTVTGRRPSTDELTVLFADSCDGCDFPQALWDVRLWEATFTECTP